MVRSRAERDYALTVHGSECVVMPLDDSVEGEAGNECITFYRIVRDSYTADDLRETFARTNLAVRVAKIRGLIPWDYDGEREDAMRGISLRDMLNDKEHRQDEAA